MASSPMHQHRPPRRPVAPRFQQGTTDKSINPSKKSFLSVNYLTLLDGFLGDSA